MEKNEENDLLKQLPEWYVALRNAYLKQALEEEKRKRVSSKLFAQA